MLSALVAHSLQRNSAPLLPLLVHRLHSSVLALNQGPTQGEAEPGPSTVSDAKQASTSGHRAPAAGDVPSVEGRPPSDGAQSKRAPGSTDEQQHRKPSGRASTSSSSIPSAAGSRIAAPGAKGGTSKSGPHGPKLLSPCPERSALLEGVAAISYPTAQNFEGHAREPSRVEAELLDRVKSKIPQDQRSIQLLASLLSPAPPAPGLAVWAAAAVVSELQELVHSTPQSQLAVQPWYHDLLVLARQALDASKIAAAPYSALAAGSGSSATLDTPDAKQLLQEFAGSATVVLTWEQLLSRPHLPAVLQAASSPNVVLTSTLQVCGLHPLQLQPPQQQLEAAGLSQASDLVVAAVASLSALSADSNTDVAASSTVAALLLQHVQQQLGCTDQYPDFVCAMHLLGLPAPGQYLQTSVAADTGASATSTSGAQSGAAPQHQGASKGSAPAAKQQPPAAPTPLSSAFAEAVAHIASQLATSGQPLTVSTVAQALHASAQHAACSAVLTALSSARRQALVGGHVPVLATLRQPTQHASGAGTSLGPSSPATSPSPSTSTSPPQPTSQSAAAAAAAATVASMVSVPVAAPAAAAEVDALSAAEFQLLWATLARLDAVGRPLESALLRGRLTREQLQGLSWEARSALLWRLHSSGQMNAGKAALITALYRHVAMSHAAAAAELSGGLGADMLMQLERDVAELDLLHDTHVAPPGEPAPVPLLPRDEDITAVLTRMPSAAQVRYKAYYATALDGGPPGGFLAASSSLQELQIELFASLELPTKYDDQGRVLEYDEDGNAPKLPESLQEWVVNIKQRLSRVAQPTLSLLARFLQLKVTYSPEDVQESQVKLRLMLAAVAAELHRAQATLGGGSSSGSGSGSTKADGGDEGAMVPNAWWRTLQGPPPAALAASSGQGSAQQAALQVMADLLGPEGAAEYVAWARAQALLGPGAAGSAGGVDGSGAPGLSQPYELLADAHRELDVERYLTMACDPRLHVSVSPREAPAGWRDPALQVSEAEWMEAARGQLDTYLMAMDMRPLADAEWAVYKAAALAEFAPQREAAEQVNLALGRSNFYNVRAEEVYLQQLLASGVPPVSPLHKAAHRYLSTINANPSWTFAQRRHAVQRLIELSEHFMRHPPASQQGSPFAAFFEPGGPDLNIKMQQRPPPVRIAAGPASTLPAIAAAAAVSRAGITQ